MGMIAGGVGVLMLLSWWARTHLEIIEITDEEETEENTEDD